MLTLILIIVASLTAIVIVEHLDIRADFERWERNQNKTLTRRADIAYTTPATTLGRKANQNRSATVANIFYDARVDYIRIKYTGPVEGEVAFKSRLATASGYNGPVELTPSSGDFWQTNKSYDRYSRKWVVFYECWGPAANIVFQRLTVSDLKGITRVDWRLQDERICVPFTYLYKQIRELQGNKRRTLTHITSAPKTKKGERDAGGEGVYLGSRGSEYRICIYQRGKEQPAIEVQFCGKTPGVLFREAMDAADKYAEPSIHIHRFYMASMHQKLLDVVAERTGYTVDQLFGLEPMSVQEEGEGRDHDPVASLASEYQNLSSSDRETFKQLIIDLDGEK